MQHALTGPAAAWQQRNACEVAQAASAGLCGGVVSLAVVGTSRHTDGHAMHYVYVIFWQGRAEHAWYHTYAHGCAG